MSDNYYFDNSTPKSKRTQHLHHYNPRQKLDSKNVEHDF